MCLLFEEDWFESWGSTSGDQEMLMLSLICKKSFDGEKITLKLLIF